MRGKLRSWGLVLLAMLVLGVGGAGGRALATGAVAVQVLGGGSVSANGGQINCGNGSTTCYFSTSSSADITLTATDVDGWTFAGWAGSDDCGGLTPTCTFTLDSTDDNEEIATFTTTLAPTTNTVTVAANGDASGHGGNVSGGNVDCDTGSTSGCTWEVPTGSTVTLVEKPDDGFVFGGWSGSCSGSGRSCVLAVGGNLSAGATFRKPTLTVKVTGNGTVTGGGNHLHVGGRLGLHRYRDDG